MLNLVLFLAQYMRRSAAMGRYQQVVPFVRRPFSILTESYFLDLCRHMQETLVDSKSVTLLDAGNTRISF
jgi:hypothetical protein